MQLEICLYLLYGDNPVISSSSTLSDYSYGLQCAGHDLVFPDRI